MVKEVRSDTGVTPIATIQSRSLSDVNSKDSRSNAATGASAAGVRAVSAQLIAYYFRAPAKAFFRTRVDYLAFARAINPRAQAREAWSWRTSTPGLLAHAVRTYGLGFIPNQVLPPLIANASIGAVLYTSYLQILGTLHHPSSGSMKRVYPPPPVSSTFTAGFSAGAIQSVVAAPLDALQVRFSTADMLDGQYKSAWQYGRSKLGEIGVRGVFAGWSLSLVKDSLGFGVFFATFEYVKAQSFYGFVRTYYGSLQSSSVSRARDVRSSNTNDVLTIKPHWTIEPMFLMFAGIVASITQQVIQHPIMLVQELHYARLEALDMHARISQTRSDVLRQYYNAYQKTYEKCLVQAKQYGGWMRWLYRGFFLTAIKQVPSTSAGLIIFEMVRRRYGSGAEAVLIEKDDYNILLA